MELQKYLPFWDSLTAGEQNLLLVSVKREKTETGAVLHRGDMDCYGLIVMTTGQLRVYTISEEGKEATLYRLFPSDICLFSAPCILSGLDVDLFVEAAEDSTFIHIPPRIYQKLMQESAAVANYTNELMAMRFSDVMWLMNQILNKRMDARVAALLLEESQLRNSDVLKLTHDAMARHLGSAREVMTRVLKYLQSEGAVTVNRGEIIIADKKKLQEFAEN